MDLRVLPLEISDLVCSRKRETEDQPKPVSLRPRPISPTPITETREGGLRIKTVNNSWRIRRRVSMSRTNQDIMAWKGYWESGSPPFSKSNNCRGPTKQFEETNWNKCEDNTPRSNLLKIILRNPYVRQKTILGFSIWPNSSTQILLVNNSLYTEQSRHHGIFLPYGQSKERVFEVV